MLRLGFLPSVAILASALVTDSFGAVISSTSKTEPTSNLEISFVKVPDGNYGWKKTPTDVRNIGQTFTTTSSFTLNAFTLQIDAMGSAAPGAAFSVSLYTYSSAASIVPTSTVWTDSGTFSNTLSSDFQNGEIYLTFSVPDTVLNANTTYGFVLYFTSPDSSTQYISFAQKYGKPYAGGTLFYATSGTPGNPGTSSWVNTNNSLNFWIQSIPEPSFYAFCLVGIGLVLIGRGMRKQEGISQEVGS